MQYICSQGRELTLHQARQATCANEWIRAKAETTKPSSTWPSRSFLCLCCLFLPLPTKRTRSSIFGSAMPNRLACLQDRPTSNVAGLLLSVRFLFSSVQISSVQTYSLLSSAHLHTFLRSCSIFIGFSSVLCAIWGFGDVIYSSLVWVRSKGCGMRKSLKEGLLVNMYVDDV